METLNREPTAYVVVATVVHGPKADPILGNGLFCSLDCAAHEVRDLTVALGLQERGATFLARHEGRPVGVAVSGGGRMWTVQVHAYHELPIGL
ncbi:hypothetical protein [Streptantibioticus ferralitis]|uniref:Uncharacterized protein n=1 Tax=Streptantibioticus ferralitis TaxID=236510 RepID=A0ABT5Z037_9ACTN|nr:hypothetical protein [Streptantibioticus ferralitis]MDF2257165.1 hypothetical protein [Streptantibioticus ferralitis]